MFQRYLKFGCLCAAIYTFSIAPASFAQKTMLQGNATHWEAIEEPAPADESNSNPPTTTTTLQASTATHEPPPQKPAWMVGAVYSEPGYVMRTFYETRVFFKVVKMTPWAPPDTKNTRMFLRKKVLNEWRGYKPLGTVWITAVPFGPPGNFYFASDSRRGPRGYFERIGVDSDGFPTFRYWFIDPDSNQR